MSRLFAWLIDGTLLTLQLAALLWLAGRSRWLDLLLVDLRPWAALAACLASGWPWFFASLGGSTPGLVLLVQRPGTPGGAPLTPAEAFRRRLLAAPAVPVRPLASAPAPLDGR